MPQQADPETIIRPFNGSLSDALGILAVEKATFDESPYSPEQIRTMFSNGPQWAWVAVGQGSIVAMLVAFPIHGLRGPSWEIDVLAVLPEWRGRRLATALIRAAVSHGAGLAPWSRAVVATDNTASSRAFLRAGYQAGDESNTLLVGQAKALTAGSWPDPALPVRQAASLAEVRGWLDSDLVERDTRPAAWPVSYRASLYSSLADQLPASDPSGDRRTFALLVAEKGGQTVGHAEVVEVQTILYRGAWIESLVAVDRTARFALVHAALSRAKAAGLDEIGAMVPRSNPSLYQALSMNGFRSLGEYRWHTAELPILVSDPPAGRQGREHG